MNHKEKKQESNMIKFEHVNKEFHSDGKSFLAVEDVSLEIKKGEIFGIIGFSGAGKSTLVRCINLLERPDSGKVYIDGQEITSLPMAALRKTRKKIGMIFQQFNLFSSRTVYENVAFAMRVVEASKREIKTKVPTIKSLDIENFDFLFS